MSSGRRPDRRGENPIHAAGRSGSDVSHSKEDALSDREFEYLLEGARKLAASDYYYTPDPTFVIHVLGRLGLRRGELTHLSEEWIDWRNEMIVIPDHYDCTKGADGGVCGYCRQLARQRVDYADGELTIDDALEWMWVPKTASAAREIYFGFDARLKLAIERYFDSDAYTRFEASSTAINRRVKKAAERAPELQPENVRPHSLRATAATYHAGRGLEMLPLMQMFGWAQPATAEIYIGRSGTNTARQLDSIHST
jgi:integrase